MRRRAAYILASLLAACGPHQAPLPKEPLTDGRGAHAGAFRPPSNDQAEADTNLEARNSQ